MNHLHGIEESAEILGISPWTVRKYIREFKLQPVRIGRRVLLEETELQRFVSQSRVVLQLGPSVNTGVGNGE
jgi:excisionase family DNA binding protein